MANSTTMQPIATILDGELEKLGFNFITFFEGTYIYDSDKMDWNLKRTGGIAGNRFRIFKGKNIKFDGIITSMKFFKKILKSVGYEC